MPAVPPTAALRTRLSSHLAMGNFEALRDHLAALRTAEFRAAGVVLAEANFWSPLTDEAFWAAFRTLCRADSRAFLGTFAQSRRRSNGTRNVTHRRGEELPLSVGHVEASLDVALRGHLRAFVEKVDKRDGRARLGIDHPSHHALTEGQ